MFELYLFHRVTGPLCHKEKVTKFVTFSLWQRGPVTRWNKYNSNIFSIDFVFKMQ
eukprot:Pgem_evm1s9000